jgi:hypothetical protein
MRRHIKNEGKKFKWKIHQSTINVVYFAVYGAPKVEKSQQQQQ